MTARKILFGLGVLMLVFSGYAYADSSDVALTNGVTVFDTVAIFDAGPIALASSEREGAADIVLANGITQDGYGLWFDIGMVPSGPIADSMEYGSAAGGMSPDGLLDIHNGVTDFTGGPQAD